MLGGLSADVLGDVPKRKVNGICDLVAREGRQLGFVGGENDRRDGGVRLSGLCECFLRVKMVSGIR